VARRAAEALAPGRGRTGGKAALGKANARDRGAREREGTVLGKANARHRGARERARLKGCTTKIWLSPTMMRIKIEIFSRTYFKLKINLKSPDKYFNP
jgi:hypothetical protein